MGKTIRAAVIGLIIVLSIAGTLVGIKVLQFKAMGTAGAQFVIPPEPVTDYVVREEVWQPRVSFVGTVASVQGTLVRTEAEGVVREIRFEAGTEAKAGQVLAQLDVDIEQAQLRAAEAAAELARVSFRRAQELLKNQSISQTGFDSADSNLKQANALVDNIRAIIAKKTIRAPFSGRLGIRRISIGQYLEKGSPIVSLHSLDPVYVEFSAPQQRLDDLAKGLRVIVSSDSYPKEVIEGRITAINPDVDPATRNIRVQATLANPHERLRPGMFVSIDIILSTTETVLPIPSTAVLYAPFGDSVFIIEEGAEGSDGIKPLVVRQQFIRLGAREGDFVVVTEGLKAFDRIVSTGTFKLQSGMRVVIDNTLAPPFSTSPKPNNT